MMNAKKREYEAQGKTVESAIEAGLAALRATRDEVEIQVLDEGSRGLLGIGSRNAVVRLTLKRDEATAEEPAAPVVPPVAARPAPPVAPKPQAPPSAPAPVEMSAGKEENAEEPTAVSPTPTLNEEAAVAQEILTNLLQKMAVPATIVATVTEPDDLTGERVNVLDIRGDDLRILIGQRGDTLSALQYISRLMVGHRLHQRANFVIDIEGYRQRREMALAKLAERMAQKAIQQKRPISLEPMPPHERRIIHMTLRGHQRVYTQSTGEGDRRKVRILLK